MWLSSRGGVWPDLTCISLIALLLRRSQSVSVMLPLAVVLPRAELPLRTVPSSELGHGPQCGCHTETRERERENGTSNGALLASARQRSNSPALPCRYISSPSPNGSPHLEQRAQVG